MQTAWTQQAQAEWIFYGRLRHWKSRRARLGNRIQYVSILEVIGERLVTIVRACLLGGPDKALSRLAGKNKWIIVQKHYHGVYIEHCILLIALALVLTPVLTPPDFLPIKAIDVAGHRFTERIEFLKFPCLADDVSFSRHVPIGFILSLFVEYLYLHTLCCDAAGCNENMSSVLCNTP
ncbi:hypothetical protein PoB_006999500 [Plakobranchus ocellatus]|uniref:Uncharacterized protein n=1 Tax=Plakobranchus ocellatus TaxID=259542 RepID=A0AAV4DHP5_9GAST|nr:hypothetical protein PoB_006999500 [Plakobranchus ocellatus]